MKNNSLNRRRLSSVTMVTVQQTERIKGKLLQVSFNAAGDTEPGSLYSVSPEEFVNGLKISGIRNLDASEALGLILFISIKPSALDVLIRDEVGQLCKRYKYKGQWMDVHHCLKVFYPDMVVYTLLERGYHERAVLGRLKESGLVALRKVKIIKLGTLGRINTPQRKRGYDDHGSVRPSDKWLPSEVHLGPNPTNTDLSTLYKKRKAIVNFLYS